MLSRIFSRQSLPFSGIAVPVPKQLGLMLTAANTEFGFSPLIIFQEDIIFLVIFNSESKTD